MRTFGHVSAPAVSAGSMKSGQLAISLADHKHRSRMSGHRVGVLMCVLTGHTVAWGPCDRCNRRAAG